QAQHPFELVGYRGCRFPELGRPRKRVERSYGEIERESLRTRARTRIREHCGAGALRPLDDESGQEAGHCTAMPGEDTVATPVELEPDAPTQGPLQLVGRARPHAPS